MYHKGGDGNPKGFGFTGFGFVKSSESSSSGSSSQAPQPSIQPASGFAAMSMGLGATGGSKFGVPGRTLGYHTGIGKRRVRSEEE